VPPSFHGSNNRMDADPSYVYDAAGNLLNDGVHAYAYDAEGRRVHAEEGGVVKE